MKWFCLLTLCLVFSESLPQMEAQEALPDAKGLYEKAAKAIVSFQGKPYRMHADINFHIAQKTFPVKFDRAEIDATTYREQLVAPGYAQIIFQKGTTVWFAKSGPKPWRVRLIESAMHAPFAKPALMENRVITEEKAQGKDVFCVGFKIGKVRSCFDRASGDLLEYYGPAWTVEYSRFVPFANSSYPGTIQVSMHNILVMDAVLDVRPIEGQVPPAMLVPPENAEITHSQCEGVAGHLMPANVFAGNLVKKVEPIYPVNAKLRGQSGTVVFFAVIGKDGKVRDIELVESAGALLDDAAKDAIKHWVYKPYVQCGEPIELDTTIQVNFSLR